MDLFYGSTVEEQLKALKKDIKAFALAHYNYDYGHKRIYVAFGEQANIGNNILIVSTPLAKDAKAFEDKNYQYLKHILSTYNISKFFLTPNFLIPKDHVSTADIKLCSKWTETLVDIVQPKFIVILGEDSVFSFFRRKFILRDHHGTKVGISPQGLEIYLTYSPDYYNEKSEYEDPSFKNFIRDNDWTTISNRYKELVK